MPQIAAQSPSGFEPREVLGVPTDELAVAPSFAQHDLQHAVEQRDVAAGRDLQVQRGRARGLGAPRVDHDHMARRRFFDALEEDRVGPRGIGAGDEDALGGLDVFIAARRRIRAERMLTDRIVLDDGEIPTDRRTVHVDCTAYGLRAAPTRPIFENGRVTPQSLMSGFTTFNAALIGFVEAAREDDADKNRLCPPVAYTSRPIDWISSFESGFRVLGQLMTEPDMAAWLGRSRLNTTRGMRAHLGDTRMQAALGKWFEHLEPALANAARLRGAA